MSDKKEKFREQLRPLVEGGRRLSLEKILDLAGKEARLQRIPLSRIDPNPYVPRSAFSNRKLEELARSMEQHTLLQPILVRPRGERFEVIDGERRRRAAEALGWDEIDALVVECSEEEAQQWGIIANIHREDLNPLDKAWALRRLRERLGLPSWDEVAEKVGISRRYIHNLLGLASLPFEVLQALRSGSLTEKHGRAIRMASKDPEEQQKVARIILDLGLSGNQALEAVQVMKADGCSFEEAGRRVKEREAASPFRTLARIERRIEELRKGVERWEAGEEERKVLSLELERLAGELREVASLLRPR